MSSRSFRGPTAATGISTLRSRRCSLRRPRSRASRSTSRRPRGTSASGSMPRALWWAWCAEGVDGLVHARGGLEHAGRQCSGRAPSRDVLALVPALIEHARFPYQGRRQLLRSLLLAALRTAAGELLDHTEQHGLSLVVLRHADHRRYASASSSSSSSSFLPASAAAPACRLRRRRRRLRPRRRLPNQLPSVTLTSNGASFTAPVRSRSQRPLPTPTAR